MRWGALVVGAVLLAACGTQTSGARASGTPINHTEARDSERRYHDGRQWVTVTVLLDQLQIERGTPDRITAREVYLLRTPVASVAALEDVARQLRIAQPDIRALSAFIETHDAQGLRRERLTHAVAIRAAPGAEVAALARPHAKGEVATFTDDPSLAIIEVIDPSLMAAFTTAERLRQLPGVLSAIPLGE